MRKIFIIFLMLFVVHIFMPSGLLFAQNGGKDKPCSQPEASQFDFWVGDWNAEWINAKGETQTGTNHVIKILGSCVVEENFEAPSLQFKGKSFSVYNAKNGKWQQTWVDNNGGYLDFTGGFEDGKMIFTRETTAKDGSEIMQRMVWYNISKEKFDWNWELSPDKGKTWKLNWKIHYTRK